MDTIDHEARFRERQAERAEENRERTERQAQWEAEHPIPEESREPYIPRREQVFTRRMAGMTLREIAAELNLSAERCRDLYKDAKERRRPRLPVEQLIDLATASDCGCLACHTIREAVGKNLY